MSRQSPGRVGSTALLATLLVSGAGIGVPTNTARADDCLTAPNGSAPAGSHWYYHTDRANQRKCWYVRATDQPTQNSVVQPTSDAVVAPHKQPAPDLANVPMSISPADSVAPRLPTVKPPLAPMRGALTDLPVQQGGQKGSSAPSIEPGTDSAGAPATSAATSLNPGDAVAPPAPTVKPQAFPLSNATTGQALRPTAPIGRSTSTIPDASAAQASLPPQTSDQGVTAVPARPLWPEPSIASVNTQPSDAIPKQSQTETVQATADTGAADDVDTFPVVA